MLRMVLTVFTTRLQLFNGPDMMALPGVKPLMDFVIGVSCAAVVC